jgi:hypothetical protein
LQNARAACAGGAQSVACQSFFDFARATAPDCAKCLDPFHYDFADGRGIYACIAPFVSGACQRNLGCAENCITSSCTQCSADAKASCETTVRNGQCQPFVSNTNCALSGFFGGGGFCSPLTGGGDYGQWLQTVGGRYCGF